MVLEIVLKSEVKKRKGIRGSLYSGWLSPDGKIERILVTGQIEVSGGFLRLAAFYRDKQFRRSDRNGHPLVCWKVA